MTNLRKLLCIFLSVLTITTTAPFASIFLVTRENTITAKADTIYETPETYTSSDYKWKYQILYTDDDNRDYIQVTSYQLQSIATSVTVPSEIDGKTVIGIAQSTIGSSARIKEITLSEGIRYIGTKAILSNQNYITVNLPSTLEYIESEAFYNAKVQKINFSSGLKAISNAFKSCTFSEEELTLPDSLEAINYNAFADCALTAIHFGKNARISASTEYSRITGEYTAKYAEDEKYRLFADTAGLKYISVDGDNPYLTAQDNCLYTKDMKILYKFAAGGSDALETYSVNENVETINSYAFYDCIPIDTLVINKNLREILACAFSEAVIGNILFCADGALEAIGDSAFKDAEISGGVIIPSSVKTIGSSAFSGSSLTSLDFDVPSQCTHIYPYAFSGCISLKTVFIPSSVSVMGSTLDTPKSSSYSIGTSNASSTFEDCTALESFTVEEGSRLKYLGNNIFSGCASLTDFTIGAGSALEGIGTDFSKTSVKTLDFSGCDNLSFIYKASFKNMTSLTDIDLSNTNLTEIDEYIFSGCTNLKNVILSAKTQKINQYAFSNCTSLTSINLDNVAKVDATAFNGCTALEADISDKIEKEYGDFKYYKTSDSVMISGYSGSDTELVIPDTIEGLPVTRIDDAVFKGKKFNTVTLPESLEVIGKEAFYGCRIAECPSFPDALTAVGEYAFYGCNFSGEAVLPKNLEAIEKYAFAGLTSSKIIVGKNTKTVGEYAFSNCNKAEIIDFSDGVEIIADSVIYASYNIKEIRLGKSVKDFGSLFNGKTLECCIENIYVGSENPYYASLDGVLYDRDITRLICFPWCRDGDFKLPETVVTVDDYAFYYTYLSSVDLSKVQSLGDYAFSYSVDLKEIYIPSTVTHIGTHCFSNGEALEKAVFGAVDIDEAIIFTFWKCQKLSDVEFDSGAHIEGMANTFCQTVIESAVMPDNVSYMTSAFANVSTLSEITLPKNLKTLAQAALAGTSVERIIMPTATETIGTEAFKDCAKLSYIDLSNVRAIEKQAFENCTSLESIDLTGVWSLSKYAFTGCDNLKKLYFTKDAEDAYIAENEFQGNETVETVVVGNGVTEIRDYAFADCAKLETALIADSVTSISDTAFDGCENLTIVCMNNSYAASYSSKNNISCTTFIVDPIPDQEYTGKAITPKLTVRMGTGTLKADEDYRATYSDNINVGTAKAMVVGLGDYSIFGTVSRFNIVKTKADTPSEPATQKPSQSGSGSTGGSGSGTGSSGGSGSSSGSTGGSGSSSGSSSGGNSGNTGGSNSGSSSGATQSTGSSSGTSAQKTTTAAAKPAGAKKVNGDWVNTAYKKSSVKKLTKGKKQFKVTWKKASGVSGYQVQYSTDSKFRKNKKTVTISGAKNTSKTVKALKSKKKYYVRIRTYKNVKVNGKTVRVYSSWSKAKSVKTK